MKKSVTTLLLLLAVAVPAFAQTKKGVKLYRDKDYEKALKAFAKDTLDDENAAAAYYGLAKCCEAEARTSLDRAAEGLYYAGKAEQIFTPRKKASTDHERDLQMSLNGFKNYRQNIGVNAWRFVEKNPTLDVLDRYVAIFPDYRANKRLTNTTTVRRKIVEPAYAAAKDYRTLSRLLSRHRDVLFSSPTDTSWQTPLWTAFRRDEKLDALGDFVRAHPDHPVSQQCWIDAGVAALEQRTLPALLRFLDEYPQSHFGYTEIAPYLVATYGNDAGARARLSETERARFDEVVATRRLHQRLVQGAAIDTTEVMALLRRGAPSWRSYALFVTAFDSSFQARNWDVAVALLSPAERLFQAPKAATGCVNEKFRGADWWADMAAMLDPSFVALQARPVAALNTSASEFLPFVSPDRKKLYFAGIGRADGLSKEDPYEVSILDSTFGQPQLIRSLAGYGNEVILSVTADGGEALVFVDGKLCVTELQRDGNWSSPRPITELNTGFYWVGGATRTYDGNVMIFEARVKVPVDGDDDINLYVAQKQPDGRWSKPEPLPANINSRRVERSPALQLDSKSMYFSSDGHVGFGGMDVFKTERLDDTWLRWSDPVNLGRGINTPDDDWGFTFSVAADGKTAFFSKNDAGTKKSDLMMAELPKQLRQASMRLVRLPLKTDDLTTVEVRDRRGIVIATQIVRPGATEIVFSLPDTVQQITVAPRVDERTFSSSVTLDFTRAQGALGPRDTLRALSLAKAAKANRAFEIPDVYFDNAESELKPTATAALEKLGKVLKGTSYKIAITGHTDDNGTPESNQQLSERRAEAVKAFLVAQGIPAASITTAGKGESQPKVKNDSEYNRAINRRVEFVLGN